MLSILCLLMSFISLLPAQERDTIAQQEIDQFVWKPFIDAYNKLDAEAFNEVHTADVLRAGDWAIWQGEEYKERNRKNFARMKEKKTKLRIEIRFDFRKTTETVSYETGFYFTIAQ